jgi:hypothetical protein
MPRQKDALSKEYSVKMTTSGCSDERRFVRVRNFQNLQRVQVGIREVREVPPQQWNHTLA